MEASSEPKVREERCEKHGLFESVRLFAGRWSACPTCGQEENEQRERRHREERHKEFVQQALLSSGLVGRFAVAEFDTFTPSTGAQRKALATAREFVAKVTPGEWANLILIGPPGTGKTHLAAGIVHAAIERHLSARYVTLRDLIREIRATWRRGADQTEADVIEDLSSVSLLAVDELGLGAGTESELAHFFDVIDKRYQRCLPVVLVSNLSVPDLRHALGERLYDRLRECSQVLACNWPSYRGTRQQAE